MLTQNSNQYCIEITLKSGKNAFITKKRQKKRGKILRVENIVINLQVI